MSALRLFDLGVAVFPLKDKAKEPACKWREYTCTREQVERFTNYGVRLNTWLGVLDADSPASQAWIDQHVEPTPFTVKTGPYHDGSTGRGEHRYYRILGQQPRFIKRDGLVIECKSEGQYVVGPGSIHPSGVVYSAGEWSWDLKDLPIFPRDFDFGMEQSPATPGGVSSDYAGFPDHVTQGERHHELFKLLRSLKALDNTIEAARWTLIQANTYKCSPPIGDHQWGPGGFEGWTFRAWNNPDRPLPVIRHQDPVEDDI